MNKHTKFFLTFLYFIVQISLFAQEKRIVGYLPNYRFKVADKIDFCKMTHLNICFANPDLKGNITISDTLPEILKYIRSKNPELKIYISLAGGALLKEQSEAWIWLLDNPKNRPDFIKKIVDFTEKYKFDGVDVDLEWKDVTKGYSPFILELKKELTPKKLELTAALPAIHRYSNITNEAIHSFDFIHIMAYDERGSWAPNKPGQHSSYAFAQKSINFWRDKIGIPAEKLTLGLPFYAYNFTDPTKTVSHTIANIMSYDYQNLYRDSIGLIYYNGKPTLEAKIELATKDLAGVMIWELGQDTTGESAMINTVFNKFKTLKFKTTDDYCGFSKEEITLIENNKFKNSVEIKVIKKSFTISSNELPKLRVSVKDEKGKKSDLKIKKKDEYYLYKIKKLKKGTYTLHISNGKNSFDKKLTL